MVLFYQDQKNGNETNCVLSKYYEFTGKELDFIINYDIKYRIGRIEDE